MSNSLGRLWSDSPNAPQIPFWLYHLEKDYFAGMLVGAVAYGIVMALFCQCIIVLLGHINPIKGGMKWALLTHTLAMFVFLTLPVGITLSGYGISYIEGRRFLGYGEYPPGPLGYGDILNTKAVITVFSIMFPLNQWLADGLLLHRCYVIYSMKWWAIAFPALMYLASIVMGIVFIYQQSTTGIIVANFSGSYFSISLSLNVLLTLMIVARLILHRRNFRKALGTSDGSSGLYTAIIVMLVESYALYAVAYLLYIVFWAIGSQALATLSKVVGAVQVIAPYLIILRVAKRRAMTSESISGSIGSIQFRSRGSADGDGFLPDGDPANSTEGEGEAPDELLAGDQSAIEEVPL